MCKHLRYSGLQVAVLKRWTMDTLQFYPSGKCRCCDVSNLREYERFLFVIPTPCQLVAVKHHFVLAIKKNKWFL